MDGLKIQIVSDLHIETIKSDNIDSTLFITPMSNILVLAGDIGRIHKYNQLKNFLTDVCFRFDTVIYVPGNSEFYQVKGVPQKTIKELLEDLDKIKLSLKNLYILNRSSITIDDVCIAGCTLWSEPKVEIPKFIVRIKNFPTSVYRETHRKDLQYIKDMKIYAKKENLKLLVITHHAPTSRLLKDYQLEKDKYKSLYYSDLEYIFTDGLIHTWIHGHTHYNIELKIHKTLITSNQKGKPKEKTKNFVKEKIIFIN